MYNIVGDYMIYLSIGPIEINLSSIISFSLGILTGFIVLLVIYMYAVFKNLNNQTEHKISEDDVDESVILLLIEDAKKQFKQKEKRQKNGYAKHLYQISKDLGYDIASKFYPESKTPHLELTLDETLKLNHYITDRIDTLTQHKLLRLFRKYTLSYIYDVTTKTKKVKDNKLLKLAEKYGVNEIYKASITTINAVNPIYWLRRLANEQVLERILVQIGLAIISITGEETYKIYSKKVFNETVSIDSQTDDIYKILDDEMKGNEYGK